MFLKPPPDREGDHEVVIHGVGSLRLLSVNAGVDPAQDACQRPND